MGMGSDGAGGMGQKGTEMGRLTYASFIDQESSPRVSSFAQKASGIPQVPSPLLPARSAPKSVQPTQHSADLGPYGCCTNLGKSPQGMTEFNGPQRRLKGK